MTNKKYIPVLFVLLLSAVSAYAGNNLPVSQSDEPIEIVSDRMEAFNDKNLVVFSGNAAVTQGNSVLKADKLLLYYKDKNDKTDNKITAEMNRTGNLEKIEAKGNVCLTQDQRVATGDEAIYYRESNKIILTGNAVLNEGKNSIKGDSVTVFLNENKGTVEGSTQKQIKAIIYPQDRKKTQTK
jgi:lipopolysaccharide export system protein LptA